MQHYFIHTNIVYILVNVAELHNIVPTIDYHFDYIINLDNFLIEYILVVFVVCKKKITNDLKFK